MSTPSARTGGSLDAWFKISARGSTVRQEIVAGLTTFLAMVYSVIVVPGMLGKAGFPPAAVFVSTCLVAGVGSLVMGLWANLPLAIGCAISLTAFTAFSLVLGQHISVPVALGAVFLMGVLFTVISATGIRSWILRNLPQGVAHGTGIGIGLFLLLIAANGVGLVIKNPLDGLPVALGHFASFPVIMSLIGLAVIIGLEKLKVPGGILLTIIGVSIVGLIFDPNVHFSGIFAMPSLSDDKGNSLIGSLDIVGALNPVILPSVLALVMTAVFDATGTIRAVAGQANLLDEKGQPVIPEGIRQMQESYDYLAVPRRESNFYRQGMLMANYEDDFAQMVPINKQRPVYHDLTVDQLRSYFSWRTKFRQGKYKPAPAAYVYLLASELVCQIGVKDKADGLRQLRLLFAKCVEQRDISTSWQEKHILPLSQLRDTEVDMFTTVFVGNAATRALSGRMVTPRGYRR